MQALAWILILIASRLPHGLMGRDLLSLGAAALAATAQWQMARALREWLGPRPMLLERGLIALCVLGPLGFALLLPQPALRTGWFSAVHGLCLMALAGLCLDPQRPVARSWRYLMCGVAAFMGLMLFVRSYLALATPFLPSFTADSGANQIFALLTTLSSTLLMVAVLVAWRDETSQQLRDLALQDMLTGLPNRRALLERAPAMLAHAQRHRQALALVMLDLDHFKHVNDEHGHAVGDRKSTRLNSSHLVISYAVFCLKTKYSAAALRHSLKCTSCIASPVQKRSPSTRTFLSLSSSGSMSRRAARLSTARSQAHTDCIA